MNNIKKQKVETAESQMNHPDRSFTIQLNSSLADQSQDMMMIDRDLSPQEWRIERQEEIKEREKIVVSSHK